MRSLHLCALLAIAVGSAGCRVQTDLGVPCVMVKKDPADTNPADGISPIPIKESEVPGGQDYISFGVTECDDFICVRDSDYQVPANTQPGQDAVGYCSKACEPSAGNLPDLNVKCPAADPAHDKDDLLKLTCRPLLLDPDTITAICNADPAVCQQYFGDNRFSTFCARGT